MRALPFLLLVACQTSARDYGEKLFLNPRLSPSTQNALSCSMCHTTTEGRTLLPGGSLRGVLARPHYFGGAFTDPLAATSFCFVYFMQGVRPLERDDPAAMALYEYLASLKGSPEPQPFTVVAKVSDVPRGDPGLGASVYLQACEHCHGAVHTGKGRITKSTPILPEVTREYAELFPGSDPALVVIEKIRHGQFFRVGGNMPLYSIEALSDEELGALLYYLEL